MGTIWLDSVLAVQRIEQSIKDDLSDTEAACLTPRACYVLMALYVQDVQKPTALAKHAGIAATGFTPVLDSLEHAELIRRKASPTDRRSVLIYLTAKGKQLETVITNAIADAEVKA